MKIKKYAKNIVDRIIFDFKLQHYITKIVKCTLKDSDKILSSKFKVLKDTPLKEINLSFNL